MGRRAPGDIVPDSCSLFGMWLVPENFCFSARGGVIYKVKRFNVRTWHKGKRSEHLRLSHQFWTFHRYHRRSLFKRLWKYSLIYQCVLDTSRSIFLKSLLARWTLQLHSVILKLLHLFCDFLDHVLVMTKTFFRVREKPGNFTSSPWKFKSLKKVMKCEILRVHFILPALLLLYSNI